jgi:hypothetical protein
MLSKRIQKIIGNYSLRVCSNTKFTQTITRVFNRYLNNQKDNIYVGSSEFEKLVNQSEYFVDKTLLIKMFIQKKAEVLLITCPRRWGKSLNTNMIQTFLEVQFTEKGKIYDKIENSPNYKLFHKKFDSENLKEKQTSTLLKIALEKEVVQNYLGKYPVIFIDLKGLKGDTFLELMTELQTAISKAFIQHDSVYMSLLKENIESYNEIYGTKYKTENKKIAYLKMISDKIKPTDDISKFETFFYDNGKNASVNDIKNSLHFLSKILHTYHNKKVYIFLDEYDVFINENVKSEICIKEELPKTLSLLSTMMGTTFKGNVYLEKGLITGVFRIAKTSLFSELNNLVEFNFLNNPFASFYGFTEDETQYLFKRSDIAKKLKLEAKLWYDGYYVDKNVHLYNPWSISNFLFTKELRNYWYESGSIDFLKNLFKIDPIKEKIELLIMNEEIPINLNDLKFTLDNYETLIKLMEKNRTITIEQSSVDLFFSYIFAAGYLTKSIKKNQSDLTYVKVPNLEVTSELIRKLICYYTDKCNIDLQLLDDARLEIINLFYNRNQTTSKLETSLENLFSAFPAFVKILDEQITNEGIQGNEIL